MRGFSAAIGYPAVKKPAPRTDHPAMEFHHGCSFCGWRRSSPTPVMLAPSCERCGCALDATAAPREAARVPRSLSIPPRAIAALRALGVLCCALTLYAAAMLGYRYWGPSGAMIAFGCAAFLLLPFVPERVGAGRPR
jgi:hypothetical protein